MKPQSESTVVICTYKSKPGKKEALLEILKDHVASLRMLGFATGYPRSVLLAENDTVIEIFEWESEDASRKAHDHPEVQKIWDAISQVADFIPLNSLTEALKPFAHFKQGFFSAQR